MRPQGSGSSCRHPADATDAHSCGSKCSSVSWSHGVTCLTVTSHCGGPLANVPYQQTVASVTPDLHNHCCLFLSLIKHGGHTARYNLVAKTENSAGAVIAAQFTDVTSRSHDYIA